MKWIEIPIETVTVDPSGNPVLGSQKVLTCAVCFNPPGELVPDPNLENICSLRTVFGLKRLAMPYAEALERLRKC